MNKIYQKSFSRDKSTGFTLIELLVVVLIIGILSAIALPQYQKAVFKSRAMSGYLALNKLEDAQKLFYLANGRYATSSDELDFKSDGLSYYFYTNYCGVTDPRVKGILWEFNFNRSNGQYGKFCYNDLKTSNAKYARQVCQELGGVFSHSNGVSEYFTLPNR